MRLLALSQQSLEYTSHKTLHFNTRWSSASVSNHLTQFGNAAAHEQNYAVAAQQRLQRTIFCERERSQLGLRMGWQPQEVRRAFSIKLMIGGRRRCCRRHASVIQFEDINSVLAQCTHDHPLAWGVNLKVTWIWTSWRVSFRPILYSVGSNNFLSKSMILWMTNIHYLIHIVKIQRFNWVIYISIGEHHYFQQTITNIS